MPQPDLIPPHGGLSEPVSRNVPAEEAADFRARTAPLPRVPVSDADLSAWLSCLLTVLARHAFEGPTPLHLFEANKAGTGKTLLAELVPLIDPLRPRTIWGYAYRYPHDPALAEPDPTVEEVGIVLDQIRALRTAVLDLIGNP